MSEEQELMQHQMEQELMRQTEEALERAERGEASEDDWKTIYAACGLQRRSK